MDLKHIYAVAVGLLLFVGTSCLNNNEEPEDPPLRLTVRTVFNPIVTDYDESSPIRLPDGVSEKVIVVNSPQEFADSIPADAIGDPSLYEGINYDTSSLLSLRFLYPYKPNRIEYRAISVDKNREVKVTIFVHVSDSTFSPCYVMSNLVIDKLSAYDKIAIWHSSTN